MERRVEPEGRGFVVVKAASSDEGQASSVVVTSKVVVVFRSRRSSWREESVEVLWVLVCELPRCACEKCLKGVDCRGVDDVLR